MGDRPNGEFQGIYSGAKRPS